ncbi:MAG: hypothetical protein WCH31_01855 [Actinomycetes bacterium]
MGGGLSPVAAVALAIAVLGGASFAWIYGSKLPYGGGPPIRSDGVGYYIYLPAALLDHDLTMWATIDRSFGGLPPAEQVLQPVQPTGRLLDQYGIGEAVMIAPFFGVGHVIAIAAGTRRNGFSWPYQAAAAAAGLAYFLLGIALLGSLLARWFRPSTVVVTLLAITFGTDAFSYATYDAIFSHAFSFCAIALVLRLAVATSERPAVSNVAGLAAAVGLAMLVRPTNLVILVFCGLIGVRSPRDVVPRARALAGRLDLVAIGAGVFLLVLLPQFAYFFEITGRVFVNPYTRDRGYLDLLHPHLRGVLFSVRKGLFFWSPVLVLAAVGLAWLRRTVPFLVVPAVTYLVVNAWVVSSWSIWWYGGSFGMRPFIDALPVFALGLAALIETASKRLVRPAVLTVVAATTLLSVHLMLAYWHGALDYENMDLAKYQAAFHQLYFGLHAIQP